MLIILLLTAVLVAFGIYEFAAHRRHVLSIPIRVHINGTRGKSSVTRLIAAGLRAGGVTTIAKVTGTQPRIIDENGLEIPITRINPVNIIEQIKVFRFFSKRKPQAVVIECMAVQPEYQWISEHQFIMSTVGVITNARMDHVVEMGPNLDNIARSLANTIPVGCIVFTTEDRPVLINHFRKRAEECLSELVIVPEDDVAHAELNRFRYMEHASNVALALRVCEHLGIDRKTALSGMVESYPDPGALKVYRSENGPDSIIFVNALAANDPESTLRVWSRAIRIKPKRARVILLLNTRADRFDRSVQLIEMLARHMEFDTIISIGERTEMLTPYFKRAGIDEDRIRRIGHVHEEAAANAIWRETERKSFVFAIGNAGHGGLAVARLFSQRRKWA